MKHPWKKLACFAAGVAVLAALFAVSGVERREADLLPERVTFSVPSGFYDEPFTLELDGNGREIYYTLDSSAPDENSIRYTGPLPIEDASSNPNVYSMIRDVALDLNPDYLLDNGKEVRYPYRLPSEPVDKATVVRAICVDDYGNASEVANAVYFVGFGDKVGYDGLKILSVTTDPDNLFGYDNGIYVLGKSFADALENGKLTGTQTHWPANYRQRGREWEREAFVCCFDEEGQLIASGNYAIRIQGGATRYRLPKSLNIIARKQYGSPSFDAERLFGLPYRLESLNLNSGANDIDSQLKDYIVNRLACDMEVSAREYAPCALFLDGEYWGTYWLTPRLKADYLSQRYGVKPSNIFKIKHRSAGIDDSDGAETYEEMLSFIADNDMSLGENYDKACEMIDVQSCVDYYALEIYIANTDWPHNNRALWRTRVAAAGAYSDGKWRWLLYDLNDAMKLEKMDLDMLEWAIDREPMFASLMENPEFSAAICGKLVQLATETFEPDRVEAFVEDYKASMADAMEKKYRRFYGEDRTREDFYAECDAIVDFFRQRHDRILAQFGERAG